MSGAARKPKPLKQRVAECKARKKAGIEQFTVEVKFDRLAEALVEDVDPESGKIILEQWDSGDFNAVQSALNRMVEGYIVSMIGPDTKDEGG